MNSINSISSLVPQSIKDALKAVKDQMVSEKLSLSIYDEAAVYFILLMKKEIEEQTVKIAGAQFTADVHSHIDNIESSEIYKVIKQNI